MIEAECIRCKYYEQLDNSILEATWFDKRECTFKNPEFKYNGSCKTFVNKIQEES